tara:strand:+ start:2486 stop:3253 length:768 start_codon:yes stop_codon:yes gene_type:complete
MESKSTPIQKIVVCFFGVVARSAKYTYNNLYENIINVLKKEYDVDIYVFNNNVENTKVDNKQLNNNDAKLINSNVYEEEKQSAIDKKIEEMIKIKKIKIKMRGDYSITHIKNAIRQMYSEEKVGNFLEKNKNKYKCSVICGPDYYLLDNINLQHVKNSINNDSIVYTTSVNDAQGFTNGFYIGTPNSCSKILKRYSILDKLLPTDKDYEYLLKEAFIIHNIKRLVTNTKFLKIRANKYIARQGIMVDKKYDNIKI